MRQYKALGIQGRTKAHAVIGEMGGGRQSWDETKWIKCSLLNMGDGESTGWGSSKHYYLYFCII